MKAMKMEASTGAQEALPLSSCPKRGSNSALGSGEAWPAEPQGSGAVGEAVV